MKIFWIIFFLVFVLENNFNTTLPVLISGGGHAGVEAALAVSRAGHKAVLVTQNKLAIARASCNPAIGGLAKGHLVKEIDALGGIMGFAADISSLQFKVLNKSKGRAVWSPRAQIDKILYSTTIINTISNDKNITIIEDTVVDFTVDKGVVNSVILSKMGSVNCSALIVASGTFLNGIIHLGKDSFPAGRFGEPPVKQLTDSLREKGFRVGRLKTGTPPRVAKNSVNLDKTILALGDKNISYFSTKHSPKKSVKNEPCYIVNTNINSHNVLFDSLKESALYSGKITAIGPRYCPSIEDKIVRFSDRPSHQLFLEPEWFGSNQLYVNGFSTSMPYNVQLNSLQKIKGLENVEMIRPGYAIEYDYFPSSQLKASLESKHINGLFFAGQINGTSGYEEAAAQGLMAGINAVSFMMGTDPLVLKRSDAYIGVLIDDLITKDIDEPYRMFTSRAEFRLSLRPDNAQQRLSKKAYQHGLISNNRFSKFNLFEENVLQIKNILSSTRIFDTTLSTHKTASKLILAPKTSITSFYKDIPSLSSFSEHELFSAETDLKYKGYLVKERKRAELLFSMEHATIPTNFNYTKVINLSNEAREKLKRVRPETIGQASRIAGVSPADISVLVLFIR
jgi:tRNA uridine 5-carboxymethylaminomethyl modification enzyme